MLVKQARLVHPLNILSKNPPSGLLIAGIDARLVQKPKEFEKFVTLEKFNDGKAVSPEHPYHASCNDVTDGNRFNTGNEVKPEHPSHGPRNAEHKAKSINGKVDRLVQFLHEYNRAVAADVLISGKEARLVQFSHALISEVQADVLINGKDVREAQPRQPNWMLVIVDVSIRGKETRPEQLSHAA